MAIDPADLDPAVTSLPNVHHLRMMSSVSGCSYAQTLAFLRNYLKRAYFAQTFAFDDYVNNLLRRCALRIILRTSWLTMMAER